MFRESFGGADNDNYDGCDLFLPPPSSNSSYITSKFDDPYIPSYSFASTSSPMILSRNLSGYYHNPYQFTSSDSSNQFNMTKKFQEMREVSKNLSYFSSLFYNNNLNNTNNNSAISSTILNNVLENDLLYNNFSTFSTPNNYEKNLTKFKEIKLKLDQLKVEENSIINYLDEEFEEIDLEGENVESKYIANKDDKEIINKLKRLKEIKKMKKLLKKQYNCFFSSSQISSSSLFNFSNLSSFDASYYSSLLYLNNQNEKLLLSVYGENFDELLLNHSDFFSSLDFTDGKTELNEIKLTNDNFYNKVPLFSTVISKGSKIREILPISFSNFGLNSNFLVRTSNEIFYNSLVQFNDMNYDEFLFKNLKVNFPSSSSTITHTSSSYFSQNFLYSNLKKIQLINPIEKFSLPDNIIASTSSTCAASFITSDGSLFELLPSCGIKMVENNLFSKNYIQNNFIPTLSTSSTSLNRITLEYSTHPKVFYLTHKNNLLIKDIRSSEKAKIIKKFTNNSSVSTSSTSFLYSSAIGAIKQHPSEINHLAVSQSNNFLIIDIRNPSSHILKNHSPHPHNRFHQKTLNLVDLHKNTSISNPISTSLDLFIGYGVDSTVTIYSLINQKNKYNNFFSNIKRSQHQYQRNNQNFSNDFKVNISEELSTNRINRITPLSFINNTISNNSTTNYFLTSKSFNMYESRVATMGIEFISSSSFTTHYYENDISENNGNNSGDESEKDDDDIDYDQRNVLNNYIFNKNANNLNNLNKLKYYNKKSSQMNYSSHFKSKKNRENYLVNQTNHGDIYIQKLNLINRNEESYFQKIQSYSSDQSKNSNIEQDQIKLINSNINNSSLLYPFYENLSVDFYSNLLFISYLDNPSSNFHSETQLSYFHDLFHNSIFSKNSNNNKLINKENLNYEKIRIFLNKQKIYGSIQSNYPLGSRINLYSSSFDHIVNNLIFNKWVDIAFHSYKNYSSTSTLNKFIYETSEMNLIQTILYDSLDQIINKKLSENFAVINNYTSKFNFYYFLYHLLSTQQYLSTSSAKPKQKKLSLLKSLLLSSGLINENFIYQNDKILNQLPIKHRNFAKFIPEDSLRTFDVFYFFPQDLRRDLKFGSKLNSSIINSIKDSSNIISSISTVSNLKEEKNLDIQYNQFLNNNIEIFNVFIKKNFRSENHYQNFTLYEVSFNISQMIKKKHKVKFPVLKISNLFIHKLLTEEFAINYFIIPNKGDLNQSDLVTIYGDSIFLQSKNNDEKKESENEDIEEFSNHFDESLSSEKQYNCMCHTKCIKSLTSLLLECNERNCLLPHRIVYTSPLSYNFKTNEFNSIQENEVYGGGLSIDLINDLSDEWISSLDISKPIWPSI